MYNEFAENITKESDPVRQNHYTTKKHWLVDFINIFLFILKLFLFQQQIPCFCWYYSYLAQSLKMFQNCLTMLHTMVPTIWMDIALWASCSACPSGITIRYRTFLFLSVIVCGRKKNQNWNWPHPWSGRLCQNFTAKNMSLFFATAGIQNRTWYQLLMNIQIWIWLVMQGLILSCMILHLHVPVGGGRPAKHEKHLSVETNFYIIQWKDRWLLYWCPSGSY